MGRGVLGEWSSFRCTGGINPVVYVVLNEWECCVRHVAPVLAGVARYNELRS